MRLNFLRDGAVRRGSLKDFVKVDGNSEDKWTNLIESKLSESLTNYFNHLLLNNLQLPAKQNLIR